MATRRNLMQVIAGFAMLEPTGRGRQSDIDYGGQSLSNISSIEFTDGTTQSTAAGSSTTGDSGDGSNPIRGADYELRPGSPHTAVGANGVISSAEDPAAAVQAAIDAGRGAVSVVNHFYQPTTGVVVGEGRAVNGHSGFVWAPTEDVVAFTLGNNAGLYGPLTINMNGTGGSKPVVVLDGARFDYGVNEITVVRDVTVLGDSPTGEAAAVKLDAGAGDREKITWTVWRGNRFNKGKIGTHLFAPDPGAGNKTWVNGNQFSQCVWTDNQVAINLERQHGDGHAAVAGNYFHGQIQATRNMERAVVCNGQGNQFDLRIWDWASSPSNTSIELSEASADNIINVNRHHGRGFGRLRDNGTRNVVNGQAINEGDPNEQGGWNGYAHLATAHGLVIVWDTTTQPNTPYLPSPGADWIRIGG